MKGLSKKTLQQLYIGERRSTSEVAERLRCSERKVDYWIKKYEIPKRTISEAIYVKNNPNGDPFVFKGPKDLDNMFLYGLGIGLYWGEGTKSNRHTVRLGNTDPRLIKNFIYFLEEIYNIDSNKLRFGLQIFSDMSPKDALQFWTKELGVSRTQFQKVIVTPARSLGTYRNKTKHGVLTVHFNNKKLRDMICGAIETM